MWPFAKVHQNPPVPRGNFRFRSDQWRPLQSFAIRQNAHLYMIAKSFLRGAIAQRHDQNADQEVRLVHSDRRNA